MAGWYRTGTVNVTGGSPNVVGVGTLALTQFSVGDEWIGPDLASYEVTGITDDTHWAIRQKNGTAGYAGSTATGGAHAVIRNFTSTLPALLASQLADLMTKYHNTLDEMTAWLSGTGSVTIHDSAGNAYSLLTPAALAASQSLLTKSVAGGSTVNLSATEASNGQIEFTGALTADISVTIPNGVTGKYSILNNTTGAFLLTFKTVSGAGITVAQGRRANLISNGTAVSRAFNEIGGTTLSSPDITKLTVESTESGAGAGWTIETAGTGNYGSSAGAMLIRKGTTVIGFLTSRGFNLGSVVPATSTSAGAAGDIAADASYIYIGVGANSWKRVALSTF
jgi:hypothetical protein